VTAASLKAANQTCNTLSCMSHLTTNVLFAFRRLPRDKRTGFKGLEISSIGLSTNAFEGVGQYVIQIIASNHYLFRMVPLANQIEVSSSAALSLLGLKTDCTCRAGYGTSLKRGPRLTYTLVRRRSTYIRKVGLLCQHVLVDLLFYYSDHICDFGSRFVYIARS